MKVNKHIFSCLMVAALMTAQAEETLLAIHLLYEEKEHGIKNQ